MRSQLNWARMACCGGTSADLLGGVEGLPSGEGAYLPCSFWLAECLGRMGRAAQARQLFYRLLDLRNDVGLLAEQYDPLRGRLAGNFPLTGCHAALVVTAAALSPARGSQCCLSYAACRPVEPGRGG